MGDITQCAQTNVDRLVKFRRRGGRHSARRPGVTSSHSVQLPMPEAGANADLSRPHLIGIGEADMSALARMLLDGGAQVSGSDRCSSPRMAALGAAGATVYTGHHAGQVAEASCVIVPTAMATTNVEVEEAWRRGIRVNHRAQALPQVMRKRRTGVLVTGSHGKTTVTSMLVHILQQTGSDPAYVFGGDWTRLASGGHLGSAPIFVAEADASDLSFRWLRASRVMVTSIDDDHPEQYATPEVLADELSAWLLEVPHAAIIANADDPRVMAATNIGGRRRLTYGRVAGADVQVLHIEAVRWMTNTLLHLRSGGQVRLRLTIPGRHTAHNAVAALTAAIDLGVEANAAAEALATYTPVQRRLVISHASGGVRVVDSFADHPTAIAADLNALRAATGRNGRLLVVFQPPGHGRDETLGKRIAGALASADEVVLLPSHDPDSDQATATALPVVAALTTRRIQVRPVTSHNAARAAITAAAAVGDVVVTVGRGDVTDLVKPLLADLAAERRIAGAEQ